MSERTPDYDFVHDQYVEWRRRAEKAERQRDALLEAARDLVDDPDQLVDADYGHCGIDTEADTWVALKAAIATCGDPLTDQG